MKDPHVVLGVDADADVDALKKAFRAKAKTMHPDVAGADACEESFMELRRAYEIMLQRRGSSPDPVDDAYGPGMRARMEAARAWRERSGAAASGPMAAARERSEARARAREAGKLFDEEAKQTLDELLEGRRRALREGATIPTFVGRASSTGLGRGRHRAVVIGAVGLCMAVVFGNRVLHIHEEKRKSAQSESS